MNNYPEGVTDNDPHFDLPSVGETEAGEETEDRCNFCGRTPEEGACFYCKMD
jgi:hypothetical protein